MGNGVTSSNRKKLSALRGKKAKEAEDARILAQTAILRNAKSREFTKDIYVPEVIPEEVAKVMKANELENATVVFSQNALNLFSYVFAQHVNVAVEEAMKSIEGTLEEIISRKLVDTVNTASDSLANMLTSLISGTVPTPVEDRPVPVVEEVMEEDYPYREGTHKYNILKVIRSAAPEPLSPLEVHGLLKQMGVKIPYNVALVMKSMTEDGTLVKVSRGHYIQSS